MPRFIFLQMDVQLFQHHLLKRWSLFHCFKFALFVRDQLIIFMEEYFGSLYSVPLIYLSVLSPISCCLDYNSFMVSLGVEWSQFSNFVLLCQQCTDYWVFPLFINFRISFLLSTKSLVGVLISECFCDRNFFFPLADILWNTIWK